MVKVGVELGIRAKLETIKKAAIIADKTEKIDYFFIPETHPKFIGVDAFETLQNIMGDMHKTCIGTGIVNVFARSEQDTLNKAKEIFHGTKENFVLGLGTSIPNFVEKMYHIKFEKPLTRLMNYTKYIKSNYSGPIFWGAVGDKAVKLAAKYADGVMFFLKSEEEIKRSIDILKTELSLVGKSWNDFEVISIRPVFMNQSNEQAMKDAKISLASYFAGNQFYAKSVEKIGFQKEVSEIRDTYNQNGLIHAAEKVNNELVEKFVTLGKVKDCVRELHEYAKRTQVKCVVAGFLNVHSEEDKNKNFLNNLEDFSNQL